jgi:hypothetical protein
MEPLSDFRELLALLNARRVEYLIVGGYALAFYGLPRYTGDLDIYVNPAPDNAIRVMAALDDFGFGSVGLTHADFERPDHVVQLGVPPVRIDLITSISGVSWDDAWDGRSAGHYADVPVHFIGRDQFIANKRSTGRTKDVVDLEGLDEA